MTELVNPVLKIRKPKVPPGRTRRLNQVEERNLIRAAARHPNAEFYAIIILALETAMRQGEILSMRWENVNWIKRTVHLPTTKNGDPRDVPLSRKAYEILHDYLPRKSNGVILGTYTSSGFKSSWRFFIKSIKIEDFHFHDLRHCAISSLLERGLNTIEVAAISGHKSMSMLKRYAHLSSWRLVEKLDPKPRPSKERPILRKHLPPYPAVVTTFSRRVVVDFPDFLGIQLSGSDAVKVLEDARNHLLKTLIELLCDGGSPPPPSPQDTIEITTRKSSVVMVSPI